MYADVANHAFLYADNLNRFAQAHRQVFNNSRYNAEFQKAVGEFLAQFFIAITADTLFGFGLHETFPNCAQIFKPHTCFFGVLNVTVKPAAAGSVFFAIIVAVVIIAGICCTAVFRNLMGIGDGGIFFQFIDIDETADNIGQF